MNGPWKLWLQPPSLACSILESCEKMYLPAPGMNICLAFSWLTSEALPSTSSVPNVKKRQETANPRKSISTIANKQFPEKNDQVSSQFTKFPWRLCCLILSPRETIPIFHDFDEDSLSPMVFFYPMTPATAPPPLRSLPLTLLCWQRFLLALSYYLVQDCVDCIHYPLL